jgi:hypothetical protein
VAWVLVAKRLQAGHKTQPGHTIQSGHEAQTEPEAQAGLEESAVLLFGSVRTVLEVVTMAYLASPGHPRGVEARTPPVAARQAARRELAAARRKLAAARRELAAVGKEVARRQPVVVGK